MPDSLLRAENVVKHYNVRNGRKRGVVRAVHDVSFELGRGETLALVGESGCGKSTLARTLVCLEEPTSGRVVLDDVDLAGLSERRRRPRRKRIQMVFQDPFASLNPRMSIGDLVGEAYEVHGLPDGVGSARAAVAELLDRVGLDPAMAGHHPRQLSGGQRQRVAIARALAPHPAVLICDEPTSALDVSVQAQIIALLRRLQADLGISYVFISHDLAVVRQIADRVAVMYLGRIVESGTAQEIFDTPQHPYTQALLASIPTLTPGRPARLDGEAPSPMNPPAGCHFRPRCPHARSECGQRLPDLAAVSPTHSAACLFPQIRRSHIPTEGQS
ncbi:ABC transporter ATP-binding protein [Actinosynnema sp. NPDC047251]|uniref:ABC-type transporter, ATPase subunit n=1 Tax=Saccharothrix espanaensis (strain ATCC 51144 / DSM 44229 / JCM 9112 / NBRC 15066 / NRRL 15764) TaxID=1179773 RepID=K0K2W6_SACES|nr:ABC transporter ATP-binding protein [Saccharothrix espanaensis]CCH31937.1 ABC-type transporter, ATPase subunit [Saccharothrix espanaensis DSM 44229]